MKGLLAPFTALRSHYRTGKPVFQCYCSSLTRIATLAFREFGSKSDRAKKLARKAKLTHSNKATSTQPNVKVIPTAAEIAKKYESIEKVTLPPHILRLQAKYEEIRYQPIPGITTQPKNKLMLPKTIPKYKRNYIVPRSLDPALKNYSGMTRKPISITRARIMRELSPAVDTNFSLGDTIECKYLTDAYISQTVRGLCVSRTKKGNSSSFVIVDRHIGLYRRFYFYSPTLGSVKVISRAQI